MRMMPKSQCLCGMTENFCDTCDAVVNVVFGVEDFWAFKVGRVRCPACGAVLMPCNECFGTDVSDKYGCAKCPWGDAAVSDGHKGPDAQCDMMPVPYTVAGQVV